MAARRLLIVMLVLLGISTLAAALVPTPSSQEGDEGTASETTETKPPDPLPIGEGLRAEIEVGGNEIPVVGSRQKPVEVGDQLALKVRCDCSDLVEIPALGLVEAVSPEAPAHFDLLPLNPGSYGIRLVDADRVVARIEVEKPEKSG